ncbi:HemK/PrmC family methyltransferase [Epilithonimonas ginsengisoli]|uniref:peptide chain release factor N(5)-glutamine methyltransferase n=1 Tax=Epilithonimonas ginsengisoli TaxID=1245592 RepID=A0ABU4JFH5_9FLAO|nr:MULTISPECIES: HemK/PrmC family methyltransferase [Chryseobacterium group]MBV6879629.1 peptide chain release factor N(5)-glutamine methyltransferase [Epilithonimonas sp. FP105]MDW8548266.1 HemK/PrmC family methyltransferase [Epilithonimonas ginsengisoli]OAH69749.1 protein-(glutamine-N5) methyltransferase, release factor-specific [Chryseobacterium sp. FP211-J200]
MKRSEIKILFYEELSEIYSKTEIEELFSIFAEHFLNLNKIELRHSLENELSESDSNKFSEAISELKTGKPFQQILGETEFYGMKFFVNEHVLIPRPETEELLELAINKIKEKRQKIQVFDSVQTDNVQLERLRESQPDNQKPKTNDHFRILDIGTGSGIIPIVLKKYFPEAEVSAIDISNDALEVARRNSEFHKTEINFINKDYLNEVFNSAQTDKEIYDVIISNPPYIGIEENPEIEVSVKGFEPNLALFSPTSDALIFYRKIAEDCKNHLSENGLLFLEINQKLGKETLELFQDGFSEVELLKDISGNDRMIFGRK